MKSARYYKGEKISNLTLKQLDDDEATRNKMEKFKFHDTVSKVTISKDTDPERLKELDFHVNSATEVVVK